jgi:hypothetical protein
MRIWQNRRAAAKVEAMNKRMTPFSARLDKLEKYEQKIVRRALESIAKISVLSDSEFADLANAILTAWGGGRLRELIDRLADASEFDADELVRILLESRVMTALHAAERVKVQLNLISGLEERVQRRELELAVRDYIAENPWLVSPEWETFQKERGVEGLIAEVAKDSMDRMNGWNARVDLVLSSGDQLLVLEFMRPGVTADWDHIDRFERYVHTLRDAVAARRREFRDVKGLMVADKLEGTRQRTRREECPAREDPTQRARAICPGAARPPAAGDQRRPSRGHPRRARAAAVRSLSFGDPLRPPDTEREMSGHSLGGGHRCPREDRSHHSGKARSSG